MLSSFTPDPTNLYNAPVQRMIHWDRSYFKLNTKALSSTAPGLLRLETLSETIKATGFVFLLGRLVAPLVLPLNSRAFGMAWDVLAEIPAVQMYHLFREANLCADQLATMGQDLPCSRSSC
ncbi:hypothetical protein SLEP1_g19692 [Rubroshorea leprosula]|uniref:RNase H type-1 domain-containing protein n=1 Tax=Rubroshorea leprosula TaxID=152421 RepID=A0AAV5J079_9ROSI|nr:hypothetical protein SLEP1_g19692 [Rubroshorea leprosula]